MTISIDNIIIKDRLREDFGDLQDLAIDIAENGLINPLTINQNYELLAGERRLRACQLLGWDEIEVRIMDTRDAEHDFEIEVSENEVRKAFTRTERDAIYERRLEARLKKGSPNGLSVNDAEREVAKELGTSRTNMQREKYIIEHKDDIPPSDFAD